MPESIQKVVFLFSQDIRRIMGENLKKNIVYGSYARGDFEENSDVDIMILTSLDRNQIKPVEYKYMIWHLIILWNMVLILV